jgi:hypothetical protein
MLEPKTGGVVYGIKTATLGQVSSQRSSLSKKELDLEMLTDSGIHDLSIRDCTHLAVEPLSRLFGRVAPSTKLEHLHPVDLSLILGLRNLQHLRFFGSELVTEWCLLSKLQVLEVNRDCVR